MKWINVERTMFVLGLVSSISAIVVNHQSGFGLWSWPLASAMWISTAWLKTERIQSLTKNK
jgi:hypothetical protein